MEPDRFIQPRELDGERTILAKDRTRLAAERTFLSWIRTGLTSIGIGIALARFVVFESAVHERISQYAGQLLILWGFGVFGFALFSYRKSCIEFKSDAVWRSFVVLSVATFILMVVSLVIAWIMVS
jgi:putative membrane protein